MKTKTKKFSRKLLALFLAVLMAASCFTGVMTSYAASSDTKYADDELEYNSIAWNVLSDEQVATALLDFADEYLPSIAEMEPTLARTVNALDLGDFEIYWDADARTIKLTYAITLATITVKLGSVDELLETVQSVQSTLSGTLLSLASGIGIDLGFIADLDFSAVDGMTRENTSSCDIIRGVLGLIYDNNLSLVGDALRGDLSTGIIGIDVYDEIGNLLGIDDGYESNVVYNIVQSLIFNYTEWYTDEEIAAYNADPTTFTFDDVLLKAMSEQLLDKINVLVTYPDGTSSKTRRAEIDALMENGTSYAEAAESLGYDPNLVYSEENTGNILLFVYGDEQLELTTDDSLFSLGYQALKLAWNTVLQETLNLVHVNYSVDRGHGTNFDNQYYYWATENFTWSQTDLASNYTSAHINAWAEDVYASYDASSAEEFLEWVQANYVFDRTADEDSTGSWDDIDETTLFNKLRYSPLADYGFDMQTGPINLYLMQTGTANLDAFFESYDSYSSLVGGLNDALVAAVYDLFPDRDNIYTSAVGDTDLPTMDTVNPSTIDSTAISDITSTLISNTLAMVQYVADTTDQNILYAFYQTGATTLTEDNLESAMIPLLIACIGQVNLTGYKLEDMIHPEDWDRCKDAEAVAFVCLREYLSYVLPGKDYDSLATITDTEITADFESCILPMARDAIIYVIEPYVPVTDADGVSWTADTEEVDATTSIFDLLNSVLCYYADNYTFTNANRTDETALGVASLLGICDEKGLSLISTDNDLWTNIDIIVNTLLPVAGTLQAGDSSGYGNFDSYSLIWEDIVQGIFEISDTNATTGLGGVSNFIYRLLTIVSATPIQDTSIVVTIYDLLEDLLNGLFGPRYANQSWTPIPESSSAHPFDDFLQADVIAGTSDSDPGVICIAINNFIEFSGYGGNGVNTYNDNSSDEHDSLLPGLMFALTAVNSFLDIIPQISDHQLETATADLDSSTVYGCVTNGTYETVASLTNNSNGVNVAYVDGINNTVEQISRYYLQVTNVTVEGTGTGDAQDPDTSLVAPGDSCDVEITTPYVDEEGISTYTITFTYNICLEDGTVLYEDLTATTYRYLTSETSWMDTVYPESRYTYDDDAGMYINYLASSLETDSANTTKTLDGYTTQSTSAFGTSSRLNALYPTEVVLDSTSLSDVDTLGVRIRNTTNAYVGTDCACDGIYYYDEGTYYDDNTGSNVSIGADNAVPIFDKSTGDILKYGLYDVTSDGISWDSNSGAGYTSSEVGEMTDVAQVRTHIAYTLEELISGGAVAAYHVNERTGQYEYIYLKSNGSYTYDNVLSNISVRGPIDGFYLNSKKETVEKGTSQYMIFMQYDGSTEVSNTQVTANINFYSGSGSAQASFEFYVCDTSSASSVQSYVDELQEIMATYTKSDFNDGDEVYAAAEAALIEGLAAIGTPLNPTTAITLADETELVFKTSQTTSEYGDLAYVPMTEANAPEMNDGAKNLLYLDEDSGMYYFDSALTIPVYVTTELTSSDVTNGYDDAGMPVTAVTDDEGNTSYYITNTPVYEQEWDTTSYEYPYLVDTTTQATNSSGALLYDQIQWSYYDKDGNKVSSKDNWVFKKPDTTYQSKVNIDGVEYRGIYSKAADLLEYTIEYVYSMLVGNAGNTLLQNVSLVRNNLNETNFDIITYNKMVSMAKSIESKYSIIIDYVGEDGENYVDTVSFSDYNGYVNNENITINSISTTSTLSTTQAAEYQRLFEFFMSKVVERGYIGDKLEAEISCASNNTYDALTAVEAVTDDDGNVTTAASVTSTSASNDPEFGAFDASTGELVNEGAIIYADNLWTDYVTALARAVSLATLGNGDYAHIDAAYYDSAADDYDARVTAVYDAKIDLQVAEIALEAAAVLTIEDAEGGSVTVDGEAYTAALGLEEGTEVVIEATADDGYIFSGFSIDGSEDLVTDNPYTLTIGDDDVTITPVFVKADEAGYSVSGTIVMATNASGSTDGKAVYGTYTIEVYSDADRTELVDTFESTYDGSTNSFELTGLTDGTYYLTISGDYAITLENVTVVVDGADITDAQIAVIACDFDQSGSISASDAQVVYAVVSMSNTGSVKPYCDIDGSGSVSSTDAQQVYVFTGKYALPAVTIQ